MKKQNENLDEETRTISMHAQELYVESERLYQALSEFATHVEFLSTWLIETHGEDYVVRLLSPEQRNQPTA